jgi:hypothetical protein
LPISMWQRSQRSTASPQVELQFDPAVARIIARTERTHAEPCPRPIRCPSESQPMDRDGGPTSKRSRTGVGTHRPGIQGAPWGEIAQIMRGRAPTFPPEPDS